ATGFLWFALAVILMWRIWADLGVSWPVRTGLTLALIATPPVLLAHSTVTNDASSLAAGAAVTLATLRWERRAAPTWVPVAVAALAVLLKATSLAVLLMACAFVLVRALQTADTPRDRMQSVLGRRNVVFVSALAAAAVVVGIGWSAVS